MAHIHEKYDYAVTAGIVYNNKILLVKHLKLGYWVSPGGHVELDEDPITALYRELEEETGYAQSDLTIRTDYLNASLDIPDNDYGYSLPPPLNVYVHPYNDNHEHIALVYLASAKHGEATHNPEEQTETRWFARENLLQIRDDMPENIRLTALYALELLKT